MEMNCWEYFLCSQGPGAISECPAVAALDKEGINGGVVAGRFFWKADGNSWAEVLCRRCGFYMAVTRGERTIIS